MITSIIAATAENRVIGKDNQLPWSLPADMKFFRDTTMGHCVIMGRKNYDSIPAKFRPLKGRTNIVITRQKDFVAPDCIVTHSVSEAIEEARKLNMKEAFIIGGAQIYDETISVADKLYLTHIHNKFEGDVLFPEVDFSQWNETSRDDRQVDEKNLYPFSICTYERKK